MSKWQCEFSPFFFSFLWSLWSFAAKTSVTKQKHNFSAVPWSGKYKNNTWSFFHCISSCIYTNVLFFNAGYEPTAAPAPTAPAWQGRSIGTSKLRLVEFSAFLEQQRDSDSVSVNIITKKKPNVAVSPAPIMWAFPPCWISWDIFPDDKWAEGGRPSRTECWPGEKQLENLQCGWILISAF